MCSKEFKRMGKFENKVQYLLGNTHSTFFTTTGSQKYRRRRNWKKAFQTTKKNHLLRRLTKKRKRERGRVFPRRGKRERERLKRIGDFTSFIV